MLFFSFALRVQQLFQITQCIYRRKTRNSRNFINYTVFVLCLCVNTYVLEKLYQIRKCATPISALKFTISEFIKWCFFCPSPSKANALFIELKIKTSVIYINNQNQIKFVKRKSITDIEIQTNTHTHVHRTHVHFHRI